MKPKPSQLERHISKHLYKQIYVRISGNNVKLVFYYKLVKYFILIITLLRLNCTLVPFNLQTILNFNGFILALQSKNYLFTDLIFGFVSQLTYHPNLYCF